MISVIHPSRNRPKRAYNAYKTLKDNATTDFEYILCLDETEPQKEAYVSLFGKEGVDILINGSINVVEASNYGAKASTGDIMMIFSDDFDEMPIGWDSQIIEATKDRKLWFLKTSDGTNEWIITLPIMDRTAYEYLGYLYCPLYKHMFVDTDQTSIGDLLGITITRLDILFKHNHYLVKKNKDEVNERADLTWKHGEYIYFKRWNENFGLKPEEIKGTIKHLPHVEWVKRNMK